MRALNVASALRRPRPRAPPLGERGVGGRETRNRDPVGGARDVVETAPMEEADGRRIAAVLAADADLELGARLASVLHGEGDQLADAFLVDRLERIERQDPALEVVGKELPDVVARESVGHLREVVGSEREE